VILFWLSSTGVPDAVVKVGGGLDCCDMLPPD
jgi:hypothetical protein